MAKCSVEEFVFNIRVLGANHYNRHIREQIELLSTYLINYENFASYHILKDDNIDKLFSIFLGCKYPENMLDVIKSQSNSVSRLKILSPEDINNFKNSLLAKGLVECPHCGKIVIKLTKDHIYPISKGGLKHISNIEYICEMCNSKKGSKCETSKRTPVVLGVIIPKKIKNYIKDKYLINIENEGVYKLSDIANIGYRLYDTKNYRNYLSRIGYVYYDNMHIRKIF